MANYFRPRATLRPYLRLAGWISDKEGYFEDEKLSFAGRMLPTSFLKGSVQIYVILKRGVGGRLANTYSDIFFNTKQTNK